MHALIDMFLRRIPHGHVGNDSAVLRVPARIAFTTDSFVVSPVFFRGGDIGKLAVCGTCNDLAMQGARPAYLSLALIIEEGFSFDRLMRIADSIAEEARRADVVVVTGDTKVVKKGACDGIFINTAGIGFIERGFRVDAAGARPGDTIILSSPIGAHSAAVLYARSEYNFISDISSDCASLWPAVRSIIPFARCVHAMRDITRGGIAAALNEIARMSSVGMEIDEKHISFPDQVRGICGLLGLDPFHFASEGAFVIMAKSSEAGHIVRAMRKTRVSSCARIIGTVTEEHPGAVVMRTSSGGERVVSMPSGEILPRIC